MREPQSLQLQGKWGCKQHAKGSTALHQQCCLHTFLLWATNGARDLSLNTHLPLELGLWFGKPQSLQLQAQWCWKRETRGSRALHQHCCLHTFLIWATHGARDLSLSPKMPLEFRLGLKELQGLQLQGHWGFNWYSTESTALHQHCCLQIFLIWATYGAVDLSLSPKFPLDLRLGFSKP